MLTKSFVRLSQYFKLFTENDTDALPPASAINRKKMVQRLTFNSPIQVKLSPVSLYPVRQEHE